MANSIVVDIKPGDLVLVKWLDAWTDATEPVTLAEAKTDHEPKTIVTLGWLLHSNDRGIKVANEYYDEEDVYRGQTFIPRGMVESVTPYKLTKPRPARRPAGQGRGIRSGDDQGGSEDTPGSE